jgi:hypothetical protein
MVLLFKPYALKGNGMPSIQLALYSVFFAGGVRH